MSKELPDIIWLKDAHPSQVQQIGHKALNLAVAKRLEQPVLDGFVVTTSAYRQAIEQTGFHPAQLPHMSYDEALEAARTIQHYIFKQAIPSEVLTNLRAAYRELCPDKPRPLALRPSMASGDHTDFAKRLRPILGVKSLIDLEKALKMAWAYLWLDDVVQYRFSKESLRENWLDLAVLIQPLETPLSSGSILTYAPQADDSFFVVEAARGLNEAVSRGVIQPDHFIWSRQQNKVIRRHIAEKPLRFVFSEPWAVAEMPVAKEQQSQASVTEGEIEQLVNITEALVAGYKRPLEIEWFKSPRGFFISQLMPSPVPDFHRANTAQWESLQNHLPYFPKPFSPLGWSLWEPVLEKALPRTLEALGAPFKEVPNWVQQQENRPTLNPYFLEVLQHHWQETWSLLADMPAYRKYVQFIRILLGHQQSWSKQYKHFASTMQKEWDIDYTTWGAADLLEHLDTLLDDIQHFLVAMLTVRCLQQVTSSMFADHVEQLPERDYSLLLAQLPHRHSEVLSYLENLRQHILNTPDLLDIFKAAKKTAAPAFHIAQELMVNERGKQWLEEVQEQLTQRGFYGVNSEPLYSSWLDNPQIVLQELFTHLTQNQPFYDAEQSSAREALTTEILGNFEWLETHRKFLFVSLMHLAQSYQSTVAEEPYYLNMLMPRLRSVMLAMSRYLPLDSPQDIFYLHVQEVKEMTQNTMNAYKIKALREVIQARKYKRRIAHRLGTEDKNKLDALELKGYAASQGEALGRVRCVRRSEDLKLLQAGEVIVTDYFEPFWEDALQQASGLILELGGVLSHGAMLARQHGIPAVAGASGALRRLKDGLIVKLDGSSGNIQAYQAESLESSEAWVTSE